MKYCQSLGWEDWAAGWTGWVTGLEGLGDRAGRPGWLG